MHLINAVKKIRACESEAAAQVILEHMIEACALICDLRASKKGKDDEAENEAQLCAALIRAQFNAEVSSAHDVFRGT